MKTLLSTIAILAAMAGTATAAPYVMPDSQPGALTMLDMQPVYSIEFNYAISGEDYITDMYGPRVAFNLYSAGEGDFLHQFSLNVGALWGSDTIDYDGFEFDQDAQMIPLTFGYDVNINLFDNVYLDLGAKAGYAFLETENSAPGYTENYDDNAFTFSVGAGIKIKFSEDIYAKVGYEFGRTYTSDDVTQHVISIGVGCTF